VRPGASPNFMPMSDAEITRRFGASQAPPEKWDPEMHARYRKAYEMSTDPRRSAEFRKEAAETAAQIEKSVDARYKQAQERHQANEARRRAQADKVNELLWQERKDENDPEKKAARQTAALNQHLFARTGLPPDRLYKEMDTRLEAAHKAVARQEDNQLALDAINSGIPITGSFASPRLEGTKFAAWLTGNEQLARRAGGTEILQAKVLGALGQAVAQFKPVSVVEIELGKKMVGDIGNQPETIKTLIGQSIGRGNRELADYDKRAHQAFSGLGNIANTYESPNATWIDEKHANELFKTARENPGALAAEMADFNRSYGPNTAEFVLHRQKLRNSPPPD
jgi:hypothetical protein